MCNMHHASLHEICAGTLPWLRPAPPSGNRFAAPSRTKPVIEGEEAASLKTRWLPKECPTTWEMTRNGEVSQSFCFRPRPNTKTVVDLLTGLELIFMMRVWALATLSFSVCTIWTDVKLLRWLRFTFLFFLFQFAGGTGPLWIPVPTKLFHNGGGGDWSPPCTCIFWLSWQRAKPRTLLRLLSMSSFYLMVFMIAIVFSEYLPLVD